MTDSTFHVSTSAVREFKRLATKKLTGVSSAHLTEAVAASLGYRTHAALRAALDGQDTILVSKPSNQALLQRLKELGYGGIPARLTVLPELDSSYTPFRCDPLRKHTGKRWHGWRNLLVAGINAGLEQRLFGLSPSQDWWPGGGRHSNSSVGHYEFEIEGRSATASVDVISGDELAINVVLTPTRPSVLADHYQGFSDGDAHAQGWLERRLGAWLQDGGAAFTCRRPILPWLSGLTIEPKGYADQGSFIL